MQNSQKNNFLQHKLQNLLSENLIKSYLDVFNFDKISTKKIHYLSKKFDKNILNKYKKKILVEWISLQKNGGINSINKITRLITKLEIPFDSEIREIINNLNQQKITRKRSFKSLETSFDQSEKFLVKSTFFFSYNDVSVYNSNSKYTKLLFISNFFISKKEIVFLNIDDKKILLIINLNEVIDYSKQINGIVLKLKNNQYLLRYKDNEVLFISLERIFKKIN